MVVGNGAAPSRSAGPMTSASPASVDGPPPRPEGPFVPVSAFASPPSWAVASSGSWAIPGSPPHDDPAKPRIAVAQTNLRSTEDVVAPTPTVAPSATSRRFYGWSDFRGAVVARAPEPEWRLPDHGHANAMDRSKRSYSFPGRSQPATETPRTKTPLGLCALRLSTTPGEDRIPSRIGAFVGRVAPGRQCVGFNGARR